MNDRETARVTTFVAVSPEDAFDVFTSEVDRWWCRGPRFRGAEASELRFEHDERGRRLIELCGSERFELGQVRVWEPGRRLVLDYRLRSFTPDERTELEIRFEPLRDGTRVVLEHRGWETIAPDHRARRGLHGEAFSSMIGLWWGDVLTAYRQHARSRT